MKIKKTVSFTLVGVAALNTFTCTRKFYSTIINLGGDKEFLFKGVYHPNISSNYISLTLSEQANLNLLGIN